MGMLNDLHKIINFATNKGVTGYHKPEDIDREIHAVSVELWKEYYKHYALTQELHDYMSPFEEEEIVTPSTDQNNSLIASVAMQKVIEHHTLVEMSETGRPVDVVDRAFWSTVKIDPVAPPTANYPMCCFAKRTDEKFQVEFLPKDIGKVRIVGLRKPIKPVWKYDISTDGRQVFNTDGQYPLNSTFQDLEWTELLFNTIRDRMLDNMFINLREFPIKETPLQ